MEHPFHGMLFWSSLLLTSLTGSPKVSTSESDSCAGCVCWMILCRRPLIIRISIHESSIFQIIIIGIYVCKVRCSPLLNWTKRSAAHMSVLYWSSFWKVKAVFTPSLICDLVRSLASVILRVSYPRSATSYSLFGIQTINYELSTGVIYFDVLKNCDFLLYPAQVY